MTSTSSSPVPTIEPGRPLTLADVFSTTGEWEESRYDVANRTEVQGIATSLTSCGENYAAEIELRLAHKFSLLKMNVGQSNASPSSDNVLVVEIIANGKQLDTRRIPFDRIQRFQVDVKDVNALKLRFWIDDLNCNYDAEIFPVIESLTVYA